MQTPFRRFKASHRRQQAGFSLIEILVVMAIIGILASIAFGAALSAIAQANRLKDSSNASQVKTAVVNYQTEYGCLPIPAGAPNTATDLLIGPGNPGANPGTPNAIMTNFYQGLCGNINTYNPAIAVTTTGFNTKSIAYLNLQKASVDANGILVQAFKASNVNGTSTAAAPNNFIYFTVAEDSNYDGVMGNAASGFGLPDPNYATDGAAGQFGGSSTSSCEVWCNNDQPYATVTNRWSRTY